MCLICWQGIIELAKWDTAYINSLPDAAFAVLEPDYQRGKSKNKNARHLPHHSKEVKNGRDSQDHVDMPHLRNALARVDQIKPVTQSISKEDLVSRATSHLEKHAKDLKIGGRGEKKKEKSSQDHSALVESLSAKGIELLSDGSAAVQLEGGIITVDSSGLDVQSFEARLQQATEAGISPQDLRPKPEDYIYADFRALSKVIIPLRFLDFAKGNVLKSATRLFRNLTVYPNHQHDIKDWLGVVIDSSWDENKTPHGINIKLKIDALKDLDVARGLLSDPPTITKGSANVWFNWEKSHDLDDIEFFVSLGKKIDGKIVRMIVTEIWDVGEYSLVWKGADTYAKKLPGKVKVGDED